jgi:hypothetical protein
MPKRDDRKHAMAVQHQAESILRTLSGERRCAIVATARMKVTSDSSTEMWTNGCWAHHKRDVIGRTVHHTHAVVANRQDEKALRILRGDADKHLVGAP